MRTWTASPACSPKPAHQLVSGRKRKGRGEGTHVENQLVVQRRVKSPLDASDLALSLALGERARLGRLRGGGGELAVLEFLLHLALLDRVDCGEGGGGEQVDRRRLLLLRPSLRRRRRVRLPLLLLLRRDHRAVLVHRRGRRGRRRDRGVLERVLRLLSCAVPSPTSIILLLPLVLRSPSRRTRTTRTPNPLTPTRLPLLPPPSSPNPTHIRRLLVEKRLSGSASARRFPAAVEEDPAYEGEDGEDRDDDSCGCAA
ncbi:hypothetical protein BJY59DRAFT_368526 [Rhodotorula toruloides]